MMIPETKRRLEAAHHDLGDLVVCEATFICSPDQELLLLSNLCVCVGERAEV